MGWLTGQDKGTQARTETRRRVRKCGRCNRPLNSNGKCPVCSAAISVQSKAVKVSSHRCLDGKTRTTRNGICAGPC